MSTQSPLRSQNADIPPKPDPSPSEHVFKYRVWEGPSVLVLLWYLVLIGAWIALVYLAVPRLWEWLTEGTIPFSQSRIAPYQDYIAWVFAGVLALFGFMIIPLKRTFGIRELAFTDSGIVLRDRLGRKRTVIRLLSAVKSRRKMTLLQGSDVQGRRVRHLVARNRLGAEQYQAFLAQLGKQEVHVV
jgi:hypothetical protein